MKKLGVLLYTNSWGYEVHGVVMRDTSSSRVSMVIYIVSPEKKMSDIITISRKDIYMKKNCFDFFYDMDGDFDRNDIDSIKMAVISLLKENGNEEIVQSKATMEELHTTVSMYIRNNAEELSDNPNAGIFIKNNYGYILTSHMEEFVKDHAEMGYKRLDILKRLKIMGALKNGENRSYDMQISIDGEKRRFYKIELAEEVAKEEKVDEEIKV